MVILGRPLNSERARIETQSQFARHFNSQPGRPLNSERARIETTVGREVGEIVESRPLNSERARIETQTERGARSLSESPAQFRAGAD